MKTGVIYARVSSIGDRQSTERQVKDLSEYAKFKGIKVSKVFEEHISGAKKNLSLIHISEPTRPPVASRMPSSA